MKLLQQGSPLLARRSQMAGFDMPKPTNLLRQFGECQCGIAVLPIQHWQHSFQFGAVFLHQCALFPAFGGVAKDIERAATQYFQGASPRNAVCIQGP